MFKKYALNIIKTAAVMFAVGVMLALAAPHVAVAVGLAETTAGAASVIGASTVNPLWLGSFFGLFGAISTAATPVIGWSVDKASNALSRKKKTETLDLSLPEGAPVANLSAHQQLQNSTHFQDLLAAKKAAAVNVITHGM
jgi:hypothetical protein